MREEDALKKACCGDAGCGQVVPPEDFERVPFGRYCVGSACMAWRIRHAAESVVGVVPEDGYCGLAR